MAKILFIEDDKFLAEILTKKLTDEKFEVTIALDAEEGLKKLKKEKPDLILLDLILPGMHGFEFLAKIKKNPQTQTIPVIILSNLGQKEEIEKGLSLGANDFLIKAHQTPKEIVEKVRQFIK